MYNDPFVCNYFGSANSYPDYCQTNVAHQRRFPVDPKDGSGNRADGNTRNVGSPFKSLVTSSLEAGCVTHLSHDRAECFFEKDKPFNGWHPVVEEISTSYHRMLHAENHFEVLFPGARPGYYMYVNGPDWIETDGTYSWTANPVPNVNYVWEYSTSQSIWYSYHATTYTRNVYVGEPSFWLRVKIFTNGVLVGVSYPYRVIVNEVCGSGEDWCE
jgi:hypothetical protein